MTNLNSEYPLSHRSIRPFENISSIYIQNQNYGQMLHQSPRSIPLAHMQQQQQQGQIPAHSSTACNFSGDEKLKYSNLILSKMLTTSSNPIRAQALMQTPFPTSNNSYNFQTRKRKAPVDNSSLFLPPSLPSKRTKFVLMPFKNSKLIQTDAIIPFPTSQSSRLLDVEEENLLAQINELRRLKCDFQNQYESTVKTVERCLTMTRSLLIEKSQLEKRQAREKAMENRFRLGQFVTQRQGVTFVEQWTNGFEFSSKQRAKEQLIQTKDNLDKERKNLAKKKYQTNNLDCQDLQSISTNRSKRMKKTSTNSQQISVFSDASNDGRCLFSLDGISPVDSGSSSSSSSSLISSSSSSLMSYQDWCEHDEVLRLRQLTLKREEFDLIQDLDKLDRERNIHIRELKRLYNEDHSQFNQHNLLHHRYLLLSLIGKGGFSEVHRAFDLREQRDVACKIHQLNKEWKEEKKANFIRHALREYQIHQQLNHKHIVKLYDVFELDNNSFCTVLEYCDGNDLDFVLKQNQIIPEKEARSIIGQILSALKYLNSEVKPAVIHYDLKPANILLGKGNQSGEIKITDFGLSKQMHEDLFDIDDGMDLSTPGAGTYWYLPPEVFVRGGNPPKISSKVDVWSVGCIFYQCLYGRRPYGHNLSQAAVLENEVILNAEEIQFPNRPQVSNEAKSFIRRCLTYQRHDRPDVLQITEDDYLKSYSKRTTLASSSTLFSPISL